MSVVSGSSAGVLLRGTTTASTSGGTAAGMVSGKVPLTACRSSSVAQVQRPLTSSADKGTGKAGSRRGQVVLGAQGVEGVGGLRRAVVGGAVAGWVALGVRGGGEWIASAQPVAQGLSPAKLERLEMEAVKDLEDLRTLCKTPEGVDIVGITESLGLVGALVGGVSAKNRKEELETVNARLLKVVSRLRKVNNKLKKQGIIVNRDGTLTMPEGMTVGGNASRDAQAEDATGTAAQSSGDAKPSSLDMSMDEEDTPVAAQIVEMLKMGKAALRAQDAQDALNYFSRALVLIRGAPQDALRDRVRAERKAMRGLGASHQSLGELPEAIDAMIKGLELFAREPEYLRQDGDYERETDVLGVIADLYADAGDMANAGRYYDMYLERLNSGPTKQQGNPESSVF